MSESNERTDSIKTLGGLLKDVRNVMLTTVSEGGALHARPMACLQLDDQGDVWFLTGKHSGKVHAIEQDQHVNVAYSSESANRWVSIAGRADMVDDRQKLEELWNPLFRAWFPKGLEDPELSLMRVKIESAEYWDSPSSKLVQLTGFVKAIATGEPYRPGPGEHGRIDLQH